MRYPHPAFPRSRQNSPLVLCYVIEVHHQNGCCTARSAAVAQPDQKVNVRRFDLVARRSGRLGRQAWKFAVDEAKIIETSSALAAEPCATVAFVAPVTSGPVDLQH